MQKNTELATRSCLFLPSPPIMPLSAWLLRRVRLWLLVSQKTYLPWSWCALLPSSPSLPVFVVSRTLFMKLPTTISSPAHKHTLYSKHSMPSRYFVLCLTTEHHIWFITSTNGEETPPTRVAGRSYVILKTVPRRYTCTIRWSRNFEFENGDTRIAWINLAYIDTPDSRRPVILRSVDLNPQLIVNRQME